VHRHRARRDGRAGINAAGHPEELANGNIVELGGFGSFSRKNTGRVPREITGMIWLRSSAEGAEEMEKVSASPRTKHAGQAGDQPMRPEWGMLPRFIPGKEFKKVLDGVKFAKGQ